MKRMHGQSTTGLNAQVYPCDECDFKTEKKPSLLVHMNTKHIKETKKRPKVTFKCDVDQCESTFYYERNLSEHKRTQHKTSGEKKVTFIDIKSPSSSPPRKRFEKDVVNGGEEMLDLDDMEIVVEKELNMRFLLEKRIMELETQVRVLTDERKKDQQLNTELLQKFDELKSKTKENIIPNHLSGVC